jgi:hypothetical protein
MRAEATGKRNAERGGARGWLVCRPGGLRLRHLRGDVRVDRDDVLASDVGEDQAETGGDGRRTGAGEQRANRDSPGTGQYRPGAVGQ